jgi:Uma2 family endonuclease
MSIAILENPLVRGLIPPLSVRGYHLLRDVGIYSVKTELINGLVVEKMSKSPLHTYVLNALYRLLNAQLPTDYWLRKEDPLTLESSEPEPDLSVVRGQPHDFKDEHPRHAELVVEVAVSSLALDREKAAMYAAAGIPVYWLVKPESREVEVYTVPNADAYTQVNIFKQADILPTNWGFALAVADLFKAR